MSPSTETADLVVIGGGAAGLATAVFAARRGAHARIVVLDGARQLGAKILVSGGSRCNVTNREVSERDYWGGPSRLVRNVLRAFPAPQAAAFFRDIGVALHEEEDGKLFPDSHRARTVLEALLAEAARGGVEIRTGRRVTALARAGDRFRVDAGMEQWQARVVVLATGGRSLPKTGSDGGGYALAGALGHGYVETTPALVPLVLDAFPHAALAGIAHPVVVTVRDGGTEARLEGAMLWTHFGISGPAALNASRHWHRARLAGGDPEVLLNVCPGETFESLERWLLARERTRPRAQIGTVLAERLPAAVAEVWTASAGIEAGTTAAHLTRDARRRLLRALLATVVAVRDSRGYNYAEVTAGGVPLTEVDAATMESRVCPRLLLVGEILDVDGRLGGFNFQWAWSSAWVAARRAAELCRAPPR